MLAYYLQIKTVHIVLALCSGGLFALRGLLVLLGQRWAMAAPLRYLSYTVDTALLTAALMLLVILRLNPFTTPWLALKLSLLVGYVVLGAVALTRGRTQRQRAWAWAGALLLLAAMYRIARSHSPWGWWPF